MGLYNSHLFHAYWLMVSDAHHLTREEFSTVRPPSMWSDRGLLRETESAARALFEPRVLDRCKKSYGSRLNYDFHSAAEGEAIVARLDELLLRAYGLSRHPLLQQMRVLREDGAHRLWPSR